MVTKEWFMGLTEAERLEVLPDLKWAEKVEVMSDLRAAGYSAFDLRAAGYSLSDLLAAGYSLSDLRAAGYSASALRAAGYSLSDLLAAGYSLSDLRAAGYSLSDLRAAGYSASDLRAAGYSASALEKDPMALAKEDIQAKARAMGREESEYVVATLRKGMLKGDDYGSVKTCGCFLGTAAKKAGMRVSEYCELKGIQKSSSSPAEQWFLAINLGDTPENSNAAKCAVEWIEEAIAEKIEA